MQFKETKGPKYTHSIPPYNGYGIEEDSLGSVFSLMPKPPKKDVKKVFSSDMFILRFEAKLLSESREDNDRKFIISFFCGNDTIMVEFYILGYINCRQKLRNLGWEIFRKNAT